jgi:hypothetical protein
MAFATDEGMFVAIIPALVHHILTPIEIDPFRRRLVAELPWAIKNEFATNARFVEIIVFK